MKSELGVRDSSSYSCLELFHGLDPFGIVEYVFKRNDYKN